MIREHADIAIIGAGFAGSLTALVGQRIGRRCLLVERGMHPRFAIGESSTPTANLILESLCRQYDLPRLLPLSKYGSWQRDLPTVGCGLKRGFSFFQHQPGQEFRPSPLHEHELLVGASPSDEFGDTHWYRADVDQLFVRETQAAGIPYFDQTEIVAVEHRDGWRLTGRRNDEDLVVTASFLVDATGPSGVLMRALGIAADPDTLQTNSWSIYSHFTDVEPWENVLADLGAKSADYPFPSDAAALHHILENGWMWVLRFDNGITSAGIAFDGEKSLPDPSRDPEVVWQTTLRDYPSLARQFSKATRIRPWVQTGRMQRQARQAAGADWALLPHAAYFLDPLFSAGNAHTLLGIQRLAQIFERAWESGSLAEPLADYQRRLFREMEFLDWLVHGSYQTFGRFGQFSAYTMFYFVGAVQSEIGLRNGPASWESGFLFSEHEPLRNAVKNCHEALVRSAASQESAALTDSALFRRVAENIAAYNPIGFCDRNKHNMYPFA